MKFRITLEIEAELPTERAMREHGTADPYAIAQEMQRKFHEQGVDETPEGMRYLGCTVVPVHG